MQIKAFCLDWHISSSSAFNDLLVRPLKPYAHIQLTAWTGNKLPESALKEKVIIFCMLPPDERFLKEFKGQIIWLPMWDQALSYEDEWWAALPKNVHIVAFSDVIYRKALHANLNLIKLKYYKNPADFKQVSWTNGNVVFYWNRAGLINRDFLKEFCAATGARKLLFRDQLDPRIDKELYYTLPNRIGNAEVIEIKVDTRDSYLRATGIANIFISPRAREGVGLTVLEAMARGCVVIANNEATMNEYIAQGKNGLLLDYPGDKNGTKLARFFSKANTLQKAPVHKLLAANQDWQRIANLNFRKIGDNARRDSVKGYSHWKESIPRYADFILSKR